MPWALTGFCTRGRALEFPLPPPPNPPTDLKIIIASTAKIGSIIIDLMYHSWNWHFLSRIKSTKPYWVMHPLHTLTYSPGKNPVWKSTLLRRKPWVTALLDAECCVNWCSPCFSAACCPRTRADTSSLVQLLSGQKSKFWNLWPLIEFLVGNADDMAWSHPYFSQGKMARVSQVEFLGLVHVLWEWT